MLPLALITALVLWGTTAAVQTWAQLRHQRVARQELAQQQADARHNERMSQERMSRLQAQEGP